MDKKIIKTIFFLIANIIAKNEDNTHINTNTTKYITLKQSGSSKIQLIQDQYGMKFVSMDNIQGINNNKIKNTMISMSTNENDTSHSTIYFGGEIIIGDGNHSITISSNNSLNYPINWPQGNAINNLGINNKGQLVTTTATGTSNELGDNGNNQIICQPYSPITITSNYPASGDIFITVGQNTNGNIYLNSKNITTPATGTSLCLGINEFNQVITLTASSTTTTPIYCNNLNAIGNVSLGDASQGTGANITINSSISDGIILNGNIYFNNTNFPLPSTNQTTPLVISPNGQIGILLSSSRYKEKIESIQISPDTFSLLNPCSYEYKNNKKNIKKTKHFGLVAEEVALIPEMSELVTFDKKDRPLTVDYTGMIAILIHQIQILIAENKLNKKDIENLKNQINRLQ